MTLRDSANDPWAVLGDVEVSLAFAITSNNTMQPGKVLCEVDAEAFLPHYFKMTEIFAAAPTGTSHD